MFLELLEGNVPAKRMEGGRDDDGRLFIAASILPMPVRKASEALTKDGWEGTILPSRVGCRVTS